MARLFEPARVGNLEVMNRVVRSATYEAMGDGHGGVTDRVLELYRKLSDGQLGTIITGIMYVCQKGKPAPLALGIDRDDRLPGLRELVSTIQANGSRAVLQLVHARPQTSKDYIGGTPPMAPSSDRRNPVTRRWPQALAPSDVPEVIDQFVQAARRAREAGVDGVQLHVAHGYLLSSFLSPFTNTRQDEYGGDESGRYRLVGEVIRAVRETVGPDFPVWAKISAEEMTPDPGMTPQLAAHCARRMWEDGIDCLEISAGSTYWTPFVMSRGGVPAQEMARTAPWLLRPLVVRSLRRLPAPSLTEAYNLPAARRVRQEVPQLPLALVEGIRTRSAMEECISSGAVDLVSLCRPLIREPHLIRHFREDKTEKSSCVSCSRCFAAIVNDMPVACYAGGLPSKH